MTRLTYHQYTNTYNFTHHKSDRNHNTKHTHYINLQSTHTHPNSKKQITFNNTNYTTNIDTHPDTVTQQQISANSTQIHTSIVQTHLLQRNHNKLIHQHAPKISTFEISLPRETRRTLAQVRTNKSLILHHTYTKSTKHTTPPLSDPYVKHTHIPQTTYSTAHTYIHQTTYWTSGCLPREWCLCWSGRRDAWQGCSEVIGLSEPSTATRRRGMSTTAW